MRTLILLLSLLVTFGTLAATPEATHCDRTEALIENAKNVNLSVSDAAAFARAKANLYAGACREPAEAAVAICADANATAAQKCAVSNDFVRRTVRAAAGLGGKKQAEADAQTAINAAQNAAESDFD